MIAEAALILISLSVAVCVIRLAIGPTLPDRVVALDLAVTLCVGAIALLCLKAGRPTMLVVGIVLALIMFLGTAAFAQYIERRARR